MTVTAIISNQSESAPSTPESLGAPTVDEMRTIFFGDAEPIACEQFIRPGQVAPHLLAPDKCVQCGQPERAHEIRTSVPARGRLRLDGLAPDQLAAGLAWLSGHDPEIFDAVLDAAETWDDGAEPTEDDDPEPFCCVCGTTIGIFLGHGTDWHHFRGEGTIASKIELYETDHEPVVSWRRPEAPTGELTG